MHFLDYLTHERLTNIYDSKLQHSTTLGTDGINAEKFASILDEEIETIRRKIGNKSYKVSRYQEKLILKSKNKLPRVISIPTHRDKLAIEALKQFIYESYADKPKERLLHQTIESIKHHIDSHAFDSFVKFDIKDFFPSIDHGILLEKVSEITTDEHAIYLLKKMLEQDEKGIPQGLSISSLLAEIYMEKFDEMFMNDPRIAYYRYVDDVLILCHSQDLAELQNSIMKETTKLKLTVHEFAQQSDKSTIGVIGEDEFDYLGYAFLGAKISVRKSTVEKFKERIWDVFRSHIKSKGDIPEGAKRLIDLLDDGHDHALYRKLNLKITGCIYDNKQYGWLHFFGFLNDEELLHQLDWFVKKCFKQHGIKYDETKIKKFSKAYFKLKNLDSEKLNAKTYIPRFESSDAKMKKVKVKIIYDLRKDVEFY